MLKNSYLLLLSCFFVTFCNASESSITQAFQGLSPEAAASLTQLCQSCASPSANALLPQEGPSIIWNPISYWTQTAANIAKEVADPATKATLDHATANLTQLVLPSARDNLGQVVTHASDTITAQILPQAEFRIQQAATHAAAEFKCVLKSTALSLCWIGVAFFGAKLGYDGLNEYFKEDGKGKTKPVLKVGIGSACIVVAIYAVCKHFE